MWGKTKPRVASRLPWGSRFMGNVKLISRWWFGGRAPHGAIAHELLDFFLEEDGIGFVAGLEVDDVSLADLPTEHHAGRLLGAIGVGVDTPVDLIGGFLALEDFAVTFHLGDGEILDALGDAGIEDVFPPRRPPC